MIYLELFWSFFQIGLLSIGGGYAALPLIQEQIVTKHGWMTLAEFTDIITIAEMTPGPIAINASTFTGTQIGGLPGALIATFGCILPSCIIVITLATLYKKYRSLKLVNGILGGLRPAVVGLIASAGVTIVILALWQGEKISFDMNYISLIIIATSIFVMRKFKLSPIIIILSCGVLGGLIYGFLV